jgi:membrane-associated phospholipid phosphatase
VGVFNVTKQTSIASEPALTSGRFLRQALGLAAVMLSSLACYLVVLKWRGGAARFVTYTSWDEWAPFRPGWVWVYLLPYLIGPVLLGITRASTFRWYVTRGLVVVAISLVIFILVPTQIAARSTDHGLGTGITAQLYENMVAIDEPPANAAPSLHVSLTCLLGLALCRDFPKWWPATLLGVVLVWLATLFTRQHHLIDVVTGILLACLVAFLWPPRVARRGEV